MLSTAEALKRLGLEVSATTSDITNAFENKKAQIVAKQAAAPTEALQKKFNRIIDELEQANSVLTEQSKTTSSQRFKPSSLSATKMHDLPGTGAAPINGGINLEAGITLAGRYKVQEQIGEGGMGAVYRAHDANTGKDIALKVLLPTLLKDQRALDRFLDEARISQQLSHPNIVNVFDVQQDQNFTFLTMELLEGQDLRQVMENRKLARQPFAIDEVQEIITAVSTALAYAHKYTVHRDIKPENIWLNEQGDYKIMDFGIARVQSTSQRTQTGAAMGTAYYMAPEQLKGQVDIDGRADQYALAVLAYELLSGEVPAGMIEPIQQHRKDTPKAMANAIHQALSPRPENRFETIEGFSEAINTKVGSFSLPSLPIKTIGIAAGVLLAVLLIGGLVSGGGLDNIWEALKPIDKKLIAQQKAQAAKLQGEIKNYKQRLDNGRRNLNSDLRDASRNDSNNEKYLAHWQTLTDNYLFEGNQLTELEGELIMGESLLRDDSTEQAKTTLTQVRNGYKALWEQFSAAENLLSAKEESDIAFQQWDKRKKAYNLNNPSQATQAASIEEDAKQSQREGDFVGALIHWQAATKQWQGAYRGVSGDVEIIDRRRAEDMAAREKNNQKKAADKAVKEQAVRRQLAKRRQDREAAAKEYFHGLNKIMKVYTDSRHVDLEKKYGKNTFKASAGSPKHLINFFANSKDVTFHRRDFICMEYNMTFNIHDIDYGSVKVKKNGNKNEYFVEVGCVDGVSCIKKELSSGVNGFVNRINSHYGRSFKCNVEPIKRLPDTSSLTIPFGSFNGEADEFRRLFLKLR